jgi:replicative DNA helicase
MNEEWQGLQQFIVCYIFFKGKEKALHKAQSRLKKEHFKDHQRAIWLSMVRYNTQTMGMVDMDGFRGVMRAAKVPEDYLLVCEQILLEGKEKAETKDESFFTWTLGRLEEVYRVIRFEEVIDEGGAKVKAEGYFPARDYVLTAMSDLESSYVDLAPDGLLRSEIDDFIEEVASAKDKKISSSVDFGFEVLDSSVLGMRGGDLGLIVGWTGVGKTTFCINTAVHVACVQKRNVVMVTTETIRQQLRRRIYSRMTKLPVFDGYVPLSSQKLKSGQLNPAEQETLIALSNFMKKGEHGELMVTQAPSRATMDWLRGKLLQYESMFKVDLLILDDIRNMVPSIRRKQEYEEMGQLLRDLKRMARTHANRGIPILTPYHINRETYKKFIDKEGTAGSSVTLSGLSSSSEAERQVDIGLFLWKDDNTPGVIQVTVLKMRDGASGQSFRLQADLDYQFLSQSIIFTNISTGDLI